MATRFAEHILPADDHASRPSAGDVPQGTLYPCTDHDLIYQSDGVSAWTTWATQGASLADILDIPTAETDDTLVLAPDGAGGVEFRAEAGGVGSALTLPEGSAPSTPASGYGVAYFKTDGRMYSKDDAGTEYGPFDVAGGGGANLADLRLPGIADDPGDIALGAYGDEMEYADQTALDAVWTPSGGAVIRPMGSAINVDLFANSAGAFFDAAGIATDFEIAFLVSGHSSNAGMVGIALLNSSGTGISMSPYSDSNSYSWGIVTYAYNATGASGGVAYNDWQDGRPVWFAVRRLSGNFRLRYSEDGSSWTTLVAAASHSPTIDQIGWLRAFTAASAVESIHRVVYGDPDLGMG